MSNTTFLDLPVVVTASGQEQIPCASTNSSATAVTKRITAEQIAGLAVNLISTAISPLSVWGNSSSSSAVPAAIIGTAGQVFRVNDSGTALGFGQINLSNTASVTGTISPAQGVREKLTANRTYYVTAGTGSDSTSGTISAPWLTPQHAWDFVQQNLDLAGQYTVTVQLSGVFTTGFTANGQIVGATGAGSIIFQGNTGSITAVSIAVSSPSASCCTAQYGSAVTLQYLSISSTDTNGNGLLAGSDSIIFFNNLFFSSTGRAQIGAAGSGAYIQANGPYTVGGTSGYHSVSEAGGLIAINNVTATYSTASFNSAYCLADQDGIIVAGGCTFSGTFTGKRFIVETGGIIDTNGSSLTYFPGSVAGDIIGGFYLGAVGSTYSGTGAFLLQNSPSLNTASLISPALSHGAIDDMTWTYESTPGTPATGKLTTWADTTSRVFKAVNASGLLSTMVAASSDVAFTGNFLFTAILTGTTVLTMPTTGTLASLNTTQSFVAQQTINLNAAALTASPGSLVLWLSNTDGNSPTILQDSFASNATYLSRRANGTNGGKTGIIADDIIANYTVRGYGATAYSAGANAYIRINAGETWTDTNHGTYIIFGTTANGGGAITEAMRIAGSGGIGIGITSDPGTGSLNAAGSITAFAGTAIPAGGTTGSGYKFSSTSNFGIFFGSGAPTLSAAQGSLYLNSTGNTSTTRLFINTNGTSGWAGVVTTS